MQAEQVADRFSVTEGDVGIGGERRVVAVNDVAGYRREIVCFWQSGRSIIKENAIAITV